MKNKKLNLIFFILFVLFWSFLTLGNLLKKPLEFSENENRYLAKFPDFSLSSFVEGEYMEKTDSYFNDHFLWRDSWISAQSISEYAIGKRESNGIYIGDKMLLSKMKPPEQDTIDQNINGINAFHKKHPLPASILLVPSSGAIQTDKLPLFATASDELIAISNSYSGLKNTTCVDAASALISHKNEYLYYRTDHHYTTYGAYLAYTQWCNATLRTPGDYEAITVSDKFNGTLYSKSGVRFIKSDTIESYVTPYDNGCTVQLADETQNYQSIYFDEYLSQKDKYAYFLGPNVPIITLHGTAKTEKSLLVFKDSFAHCLAPMLLNHFDTVTLVDLRYFNGTLENTIDLDSFDEVLYLFGTDTFFHQSMLSKLDS